MRWKAVLFDLNDTLIDTRKSHRESLRQTVDLFLGRWSESEGIEIDQLIDSILKAGQTSRSRLNHKQITLQDFQYLRLKEAMEPYGIPVTRDFAGKLYNHYLAHRQQYVLPYPGLKETLSSIHRYANLGIVSNGKAEAMHKRVKQLGIEEWIPYKRIFSSSQYGMSKSSGKLFQHVLKELEVSPKEAIYIGNSWAQDIKGAMYAGLKAVWFNPNHKKKPNDTACYEIHSLPELIPLIATQ